MHDVWRQETATVRSVTEALNSGSEKPRAYTTYMTIMARLHRKGLLNRRREGKMDVYVPALTHEEYVEARAQSGVAALVQQYGDVALVHFARQMGGLDPERQKRLRRLARRA